ncbi:MAG: NAD(+) synthase [Atopobiaceae bacterium]|nr:NAD(+) synthase [Atopobiaceae bacterium]
MRDGFVKVAACAPRIRVADVGHNVGACVDAIFDAAQAGAKVVVLPELCLTGATCGDLFYSDVLIDAALEGVFAIAQATIDLDVLAFVGAPICVDGKLYDCAVALGEGEILAIVPKRAITAAQARQFSVGPQEVSYVYMDDETVPFGSHVLLSCATLPDLVVAAEVGEDARALLSPAAEHVCAGATLVVSLAASPSLVQAAQSTRDLIRMQSDRLACAYVLANVGAGESTTDAVYGGQCLVAEKGAILSEAEPFGKGRAISEIDVLRLAAERRGSSAFRTAATPSDEDYAVEEFVLDVQDTTLTRAIDAFPFIPDDDSERAGRCEEILNIQAHALAERMRSIGCRQAVVGISGGLDSTLALLVTARAFDVLGLDHAGIVAITMPGFGTTDRTHNNAWQLTEALGATPREIPIGEAVRQHFQDIGHDESVRNAAYENAQARERTQILMDVANDNGGIVVGTGDLSELALGWATYNGDHMSMYAVNGAIPKTLIRYIVRHVADTCENEREAEVLLDVLDTPVSPELLPANEDGTIAQQTEDLVGPYELHDFFLYQLLRYSFSPRKIYRLAQVAFAGEYGDETILKWLRVFCRRFFSQQFKRSCSPDGPAVGSVGLSPRGGLAMPSDAASTLWLAELDKID